MTRKTIPLSNVDAAWLSMDDPTNLMMISGVMTFKKPLNMDHLLAVVQHRWLKFDRFSMRMVQPSLPLSKPYWETDPNFDVAAHLHRIALPEPGDQKALQQMVSDLMSTPLDFSKPLWHMHIVENYGEGCAIIARMHHSIADGLALVYVLLSLTDITPDAPWPEGHEDETSEKEKGGLFDGPISSLFKQGLTTANSARKFTGRAISETRATMRDTNKMLELMMSGVDAGYAASRLLLRTNDPQTPFKGSLGVMKKAAWSNPLPLRNVKMIKNATKTTVNDVLISAMTGGLRRYLLEEGVDTDEFRAVIPVNLRTPEEMGTLGNKFGLVFLALPVHIEDPLERLAEVHLRMAELKGSAEAVVSLGILNVMGLSPSQIQELILTIFAYKATGVLTNVPGPPMPLFLAGREIQDLMFWVPQAGRLGLGISILSYAGKVYLGVATDVKLVSEPDRVIEGFYKEFELLNEALHLTQPRPMDGKGPGERPSAPQQVDDLTKIHGIGPAVASLLNENGISSYQQLSKTKITSLKGMLEAGGPRYANMDVTNWPAQARYLANLG